MLKTQGVVMNQIKHNQVMVDHWVGGTCVFGKQSGEINGWEPSVAMPILVLMDFLKIVSEKQDLVLMDHILCQLLSVSIVDDALYKMMVKH